MGQLVNRKFREWTEGLDSRQAMISIFSHIRDIPYALVTDPVFHDSKKGPEFLLKQGRGSCAPKHFLLAAMYRMLNVDVAYATFPFLWGAQEIRFTPALRQVAVSLPVSYHLACRVQIGCRWILVDATWDPPLGKAGFPINLNWDGYAETECAVKPLNATARKINAGAPKDSCRDSGTREIVPREGEKNHWEAEDRQRFYDEKVRSRTPDDIRRASWFYQDLNAWMERVRNPDYPAG